MYAHIETKRFGEKCLRISARSKGRQGSRFGFGAFSEQGCLEFDA